MSSEEETHHDDAAALNPSTTNTSLFTPSGLFLVLNLMIFTIALSSKLTKRKTTRKAAADHHETDEEDDDELPHDDQTHTQFPGFQQFRYQHTNMSPPDLHPHPSSEFGSFYGTHNNSSSSHGYEPPRETEQIPIPKPKKFRRAKSDIRPKQLRKSWSVRSTSSTSDYRKDASDVEKRRPSSVREGKRGGDEEVDARADDFINRFKHQLKLQRMDSFARYRSDKATTTTTRVDVVK